MIEIAKRARALSRKIDPVWVGVMDAREKKCGIADKTALNDQASNTTTQAKVKFSAEAPSIAIVTLDTVASHAAGVLLSNGTRAQS
ncbi:hypothetical protein GCM10007385_37680 [Tateyamaria omphalii]|uniref:RebB family R body protein n=1 Tax=Tateyamaria omphalii TaxID=299262 RepID=UPI0016721AEA|nr:RebB family R body protein [Tateyamaria omphalii]GGX65008.1 hypothetical protein GCM10007385_37680 [Tateyamaria omphalii]